MRTRTLRGRLLAAFESSTVEELAAAVAAIQLISTHHKNEPVRPFTASPASQPLCKFHSNYSTERNARN